MKVDAGGCFRPTADPCNKVIETTITSLKRAKAVCDEAN
jgi:hypothetical protein